MTDDGNEQAAAPDLANDRDRALGRIATLRLEARIPPVIAALAEAGVPSIVLKGPTTRLRLYEADEVRPTADIDVLVPGGDESKAAAVLRWLGYRLGVPGGHADSWRSPDGTYLDLHVTLPFCSVGPKVAWAVLSSRVVRIEAGGASLPVLDEASHFVHLAVHAVQVGGRPLDELRRAQRIFSAETQIEAEAVAAELGLTEVLAAALGHATAGDSDAGASQTELPARRLATHHVGQFLSSSVSWQERLRSLRRPVRQFWATDRVESWLVGRGRTLPSGPMALRLVKTQRAATILGGRSWGAARGVAASSVDRWRQVRRSGR